MLKMVLCLLMVALWADACPCLCDCAQPCGIDHEKGMSPSLTNLVMSCSQIPAANDTMDGNVLLEYFEETKNVSNYIEMTQEVADQVCVARGGRLMVPRDYQDVLRMTVSCLCAADALMILSRLLVLLSARHMSHGVGRGRDRHVFALGVVFVLIVSEWLGLDFLGGDVSKVFAFLVKRESEVILGAMLS